MAAAELAPAAGTLWNEEDFMSNATLPETEFPRAMSGYAPSAVEEYVRLANTRVELMQRQIEQQSAMTARLMDEKDRLSAEVQASHQRVSDALDKEVSIASAILMTEQRRVQIEQEMEAERATARAEDERVRAQAQAEAQQTLERARAESELMTMQARRQAETQARQAEEIEQQA